MPDPVIVSSFQSLLHCFACCFTAPSMKTFEVLMAGWVLDLRRHTVTEVVRAAGAAPAPKRKKGQMGRPRVRGKRLLSPEQQARKKNAPWKNGTVTVYGKVAGLTFADMLATLRRASWSQRLFDPASSPRELRKRLRPLVDYVASAA